MKKLIFGIAIILLTISLYPQSKLLLLMGDEYPYQAESKALFSRMTGLSTTDKLNIDNLIAGLKADGNWTKLDVLKVYAVNSSANALLDWKSASYNAQPINSPTFTVYKGFTGNGSNTAINHNYNPATQGVNFALNNNSFGVWLLTNVDEVKVDIGAVEGGNNIMIYARRSSRIYWQDNGINDVNYNGVSTSIGFTVSQRVNGTQTTIWRDGISKQTSSVTSTNIPNREIWDLCLNDGAGGQQFSTKQIAVSFAGSGDIDILKLYQRLQTYLTAVGAL